MSEVLLAVTLLSVLTLALVGAVLGARRLLVPSEPVSLTVNGTETFTARTGERLLPALNNAGVLLPSACAGAGTCGLCRVTVTEGGGPVLPTEAARLTRADQHAGVHLACQTTIRGDMALEVDEALIGAESFKVRVSLCEALTPQIRELTLQLPEDRRPDIVAGSFVQVTAPPFTVNYAEIDVPEAHEAAWKSLRHLSASSPEPVTRAYSISSRPDDIAAGRIVLDIRLALPPPSVPSAPPGLVSSWMFGLKPGDHVEISGPFGSVRVQDTDAEMVFIGGGVGMAPLRAMIFEQLERKATKRKMSFWYGARSLGDLYHKDELDQLAAEHDNFEWTVVLSDPAPDSGWTGATGFVHSVVLQKYLKDHPAPETCEYYLCGPPLMIRAVLAMLDDLGVDRDHIFNDDFGV